MTDEPVRPRPDPVHEARYRALIEASAATVWTTDAQGIVVEDSPSWRAYTGQTLEQWLGLGWADAIHPDERERAARQWAESVAAQTPVDREFRLYHAASRTWRLTRIRAVPVRDVHGEVRSWIGMNLELHEQRETETRLRESESRFRLATDAVPHIVWITDAEARAEYFNRRWFEYTGAPREPTTAAMVAANYVHPDDAAPTLAAFEQAQGTGTTFAVEHRIRSASGEYRWFLVHGEPYRDPTSGAIVRWYGTSIDIHDRKLAEAKMRDSEERLRLATEHAEIGFWDVDVVNSILHWPPRVKALFGISADEPVSMADFYAGLHPDDRAATHTAYMAAVDSHARALYDVEYRTVGKEDGVVRWVAAKGRGVFDDDGRCIRVVGTAIDITARKAIEQQLRELNETLETRVRAQTAERNRVWSMSRDLFAVAGFDGTLKAINPAWEATLGYDEATFLSMGSLQRVHPEDHAAIGEVLGRLRRGEVIERFEDRLRAKDGTWRWLSWSLVPEGNVFYAVGRDVTAEKHAAAELERAQQALRQSQKMEAMGQLTGGVAHDFNNLLTPIVGSLDMLLRRGLQGEREQRLVAGAMQSAERAKTLVQRLLAFARRQPLQPTSVDLSRLVREMAELIASTTGPQIKIVVEADDDLPAALADANQVEMALLNLAVNARDAMPEGGTLRLSASAETIGANHPAKLSPGRYVRLSVADTGTGMDEATMARAVEPFFSTKGVGQGTGLGLSMVHGLASQLGGALTIASRVGLGTNIELWLPQTTEAPASSEQTSETPTIRAVRGRALLVDDEALVRMSTAAMLSELGYSVIEAASAEDAIVRVKGGERFDLLVTDHLMPGMSGTDLAMQVQAGQPGIAVLLISGYAESEGISPDLPRLAKPFRIDELAAALVALS